MWMNVLDELGAGAARLTASWTKLRSILICLDRQAAQIGQRTE